MADGGPPAFSRLMRREPVCRPLSTTFLFVGRRLTTIGAWAIDVANAHRFAEVVAVE